MLRVRAGDEAPKSQLVMAWLLGESTDLAGLLQANFAVRCFVGS